MITANTITFPANVISLVSDILSGIDTDLAVHHRPLRTTDENQCIGIFASDWTPDNNSWELLGRMPSEPTVGTYKITIQVLIKDMDTVNGLAVHSILSALVRSTLVRNLNLKQNLSVLTVTLDGGSERVQHWKVTKQNFLSNELVGGIKQWLFFSSTDLLVQTNITF